jgi:hypothetical protein
MGSRIRNRARGRPDEVVEICRRSGSRTGDSDPKELVANAVAEEAGFDHVAVLQAGPDQAGFLRSWAEELRPRRD